MDPNIGSGYKVAESFLRIGDTQFFVPPTSIKVHRQSQVEMDKLIRSKSSSPKESGYYEQIIEFHVLFPDLYSINNELRPLLAQSKKFPFLPVENTYLNETLSIPAITISNVTVQTVVGFPNCMMAVIQAFAFNPTTYVYGEGKTYDEMFNWKMFRWHYTRNLTPEAKKAGRTYYERLTTELNNEFKFYIAAEDELQYMREWRLFKNELIRRWRNDKKNKPGFDSEDWKSALNPTKEEWDEMRYKIFAGKYEMKNYFDDEADEKEFFRVYNAHMKEKMNTYDVTYDPVPIAGLTLLDMSVSFSNDIANHQTQMSPYSTHQFLGSSDVTAQLRFLAPDEETLNSLDAALNRAAYLTREFHKEMGSGYIKFDHQLTRLFGMTNVVIGDVSYTTVDNQPGVHEVNMTVYGYNKAEKRMHETQALMSGGDIEKFWSIDKGEDSRMPWLVPFYGPAYALANTPMMKKHMKKLSEADASVTMDEEKEAVYNAHMMEMFKMIEMYPDLELPTYKELEEAGFKVTNLNDGFFADPDFFIRYDTESYYHNILVNEMKKSYDMSLLDGGGGGVEISGADHTKMKINKETQEEIKSVEKELNLNKKEETPVVGKNKKIPAPENAPKELVESWIREQADAQQFNQSYAVGFAKYFDEKLRHTYEKGVNKDFGQINVGDKDVVIEMNGVDSYVQGKYEAFNHVGVMRVQYRSNEEITSIHGNVHEGVIQLTSLYNNSAKNILESEDAYRNLGKAYKAFGIPNDGKSKNKSRMKFALASIIYMGGDTDIKAFLKGKTNKIPQGYLKLAKGVLKQADKNDKKWTDKKIEETIDDIRKNTIKDYQTKDYKEDTSSTPAVFDDNVVYDTEDDMVVRNAMLVDALKYDKRGRMVCAFPTFLLTFVDEGQFVGNVKMADQHFNYRAVRDIVFTNSRKQAAPTLMLEVSNVYETLSDAEKAEDLSHQGFGDMLNYFMRPGAYAKETQERTRNMDDAYYKSVYLKTGVRVHFRMGYGSNPAEMPTLLNGPITSLKNNGSSMTLIAQGDGIELTRSMSAWFSPDDETTGFLWAKKEPTQILDEILTDDRGLMSNVKTLLSNKEYEHHSMGIMHFGAPGEPMSLRKLKGGVIGGVGGTTAGLLAGSVIGGVLGGGAGLAGGWMLGKKLAEVDRNLTPINMNVHQTTGIANGTDTLWNKISDFFGIGQGDEDGVAYSLFDKTVWDIASINASIGSDMIAAVHPFGFRSTLFVGKPYFPLHYDYMVKDEKVVGTCLKSFRQVHGADSYTNIIANRIEATEENMYTTAVGTFMRNGELAATDTVYVDSNIWPEKQKNVVIDTTLNAKGFRMLQAVGKIPVIGGIADAINSKTGQWMFDEGVALKMTYSGLRDYVKDMYDGYLTIMGNASIKPYDYISLQDSYANMGGMFEVKEVTHMMNNDVGFISMIKPDVIVYNSDSRVATFGMIASQVVHAAGLTLALRCALNMVGFQGNFPFLQAMWGATKWTFKKTVQINKLDKVYNAAKKTMRKRKDPNASDKQEDVVTEEEVQKNKERAKADLTRNEQKLFEKKGYFRKIAYILELEREQAKELGRKGMSNMRTRFPKTIGNIPLGAQSRIGNTLVKTLFSERIHLASKVAKGGKAAYRAMRGAAALLTGPIGLIAFAVEFAIVEVICATIGEFIERWLVNRQCCVIVPLKKDGTRMLAGVNGHKGSVAGDSQDFVQSIAEHPVSNFLLSLLGVNVPNSQPPGLGQGMRTTGIQTDSGIQPVAMGLANSIRKTLTFSHPNKEESSRDRTTTYLHRLDLVGVKARKEDNKEIQKKLASLVPNYDDIKETFKTIASSFGSALKKALQKIKDFFGAMWDKIKGMFDKLKDLITDDDESGSSESCVTEMPKGKDYKGPANGAHGQVNIKGRLTATDKYNDLIFKVSKKRGVNPVFVKVIMAIESAGTMNLISSADAYGLMQVVRGDGRENKYNWNKMLKDAEYNINAGIDVIFEKAGTAKRIRSNANVFWVANYYYGHQEGWSTSYGEQARQMYEGMGLKDEKNSVLKQVVEGECEPTGGANGTKVNGTSPETWPTSAGYGDVQQQKHRQTRGQAVSFTGDSNLSVNGGVKLRKDMQLIVRQVAKEYKGKFKEKMVVTSGLRPNDAKSWHGTGWGCDIDVPGMDKGGHMTKLKGGLRGYPASMKSAYEKAKFIADRLLYYSCDGIVFGDTRIKAELLKKHKNVNWKQQGASFGDHDGHIHVCCPNKNRLQKDDDKKKKKKPKKKP